MRLTVYGVALPQGSKSARVVNGRAIMTDGFGDKPRQLKSWREAIADAARVWIATNGAPAPLDVPVTLHATFYLPKPKSAPRKAVHAAKKPDLSKLTRAIEDALTKLAYTDDSRIVELTVRKRYAIDTAPRVEIFIAAALEAA